MAKQIKPVKVAEKIEPRLELGLVIASPSLIVDKYGVAWWIDPTTQRAMQVRAE